MARSSLDGVKAATCLQRESAPDEKTIQCPLAARAAGSLTELIHQRRRSLIQLIERIELTHIVNPKHQNFSVFSSRHVPLGLGSVLIECGYKAKNPGRSGRCDRIAIPTTFNPGITRNIPLS